MPKVNGILGFVGAVLILFAARSGLAQGFGKNKIQYSRQHWKYIQTEHYDIYFYGDGLQAAKFTATMAEAAYRQIRDLLNFEMQARSSIILYNSHNDFEETNVSPEIQEESVGGFTEFFKNRIVFPYEGSAEQFRHVIHHELFHSLHLQFFYGTGPGAIIQGLSSFALPGWFTEGSAEYASMGWDTESDNFIRDAVISGYLPEIPYLSAFLAYKGGQAFLYWVERKYGREKITQLNGSMRRRRSVERTFQAVFGMSVREVSEQWHRDLKREYWPEISRREMPEDLATRVTDHKRNINFVNNSPSLSPGGDYIAYLSDQAGKFDIYLVSTLDLRKPRKILSGQKNSGLEELKWLRPGITWAPDGNRIAFAAKAGEKDALHIYDLNRKRIVRTFKPDLDGLWSPAWSPDGARIAFMGARAGQSDILTINVETGELHHVTHDPPSDLEPAWSPDGKWIVFTSDRAVYQGILNESNAKEKLANTDIFRIHPDGTGLEQLTKSPYTEKSPGFFAGSDTLVYTSNANGIMNIYAQELRTGRHWPMTDLITGVSQLSTCRSARRLAFAAFQDGGYDIYLWKTPFAQIDSARTLLPTPFRERELASPQDLYVVADAGAGEKRKFEIDDRPYSKYVFDADFRSGKVEPVNVPEPDVVISEEERLDESGGFRISTYKPKFSVDYVGGAGGYDPFFGVSGYTQLILSDLLGNQQFALGLNLIRDIENSDIFLAWAYMPHRPDFALQFFHVANFFQTSVGIERIRHIGAQAAVFYPLSRFKRIELGANLTHLREQNLIYNFPMQTTTALPISAALVSDNTIWRFFGPFTGTRYRLNLIYAPGLGDNYQAFRTGMLDYRTYLPISREIGFALRISGGSSGGRNPINFVLGGVENWLNYSFKRNINATDITDFYFSYFVMPLRGTRYYERVGTNFFLINAELRFPLVDYLIVRFPLPLGLANIRGAGFLDAGSAWNTTRFFKALADDPVTGRRLNDLIASFGWGLRANLGIFLLRVDTAWRTDLQSTSKPRYLFSLGTDF